MTAMDLSHLSSRPRLVPLTIITRTLGLHPSIDDLSLQAASCLLSHQMSGVCLGDDLAGLEELRSQESTTGHHCWPGVASHVSC